MESETCLYWLQTLSSIALAEWNLSSTTYTSKKEYLLLVINHFSKSIHRMRVNKIKTYTKESANRHSTIDFTGIWSASTNATLLCPNENGNVTCYRASNINLKHGFAWHHNFNKAM